MGASSTRSLRPRPLRRHHMRRVGERRSNLSLGHTISRARCRQLAATLLQSTELDGIRGTGEGSTISSNYKAMRAKIFDSGATAEEISQQYSSVDLASVTR